ncbi:hypothetical protein BDY19DRAFT_539836 [Irpex rosettiformis]|uniref:Uncharacterized protein n=1 Tax=Irpex rosettiformis TaxID=378272 RepID=A0ACB8TQY5_9APHY|nr:hypothetical protein BDY19DRAFT_539836 [Irpex rosettiformis]
MYTGGTCVRATTSALICIRPLPWTALCLSDVSHHLHQHRAYSVPGFVCNYTPSDISTGSGQEGADSGFGPGQSPPILRAIIIILRAKDTVEQTEHGSTSLKATRSGSSARTQGAYSVHSFLEEITTHELLWMRDCHGQRLLVYGVIKNRRSSCGRRDKVSDHLSRCQLRTATDSRRNERAALLVMES